ncbi:hypothetical protein BHE74_00044226 [Ensete ventricosum]|nr:hypothetical protein GW17_00023550 [Ensete ventricosum]RWW49581.1 hypothetical protein BHE74_00044226 [Ensete ventricosum]RZR95283.1 hypothetical protein BHM03_00024108 [Ensete ventricosum]
MAWPPTRGQLVAARASPQGRPAAPAGVRQPITSLKRGSARGGDARGSGAGHKGSGPSAGKAATACVGAATTMAV